VTIPYGGKIRPFLRASAESHIADPKRSRHGRLIHDDYRDLNQASRAVFRTHLACKEAGAAPVANRRGVDRGGSLAAGAAIRLRGTCYLLLPQGAGRVAPAGGCSPRSEQQAAALYEQACDAQFGEACVNLAVLYTGGGEILPDVTRAVALFARGCDLGEPIACFDLANHYADGTGVEQDTERAAALYAQACTGGYEAACAKAAAKGKALPPRS
jgi:hypothetical protein